MKGGQKTNTTDRLVENINGIIKERGLKQKYLADMRIDERKLSSILTRHTKNVNATDIEKLLAGHRVDEQNKWLIGFLWGLRAAEEISDSDRNDIINSLMEMTKREKRE